MTTGALTLGFSDAAQFLQKTNQAARRRLHESQTFGIESTVREELATVWEDCRKPNWDGYQALAVNWDTLHYAHEFLESLPLGFPPPSVGAEPDGALTLEWYRTPRRVLSISIHPDGNLHYAALLGPNRIYGTEVFFGEVPDSILALIHRV